MDTYGIEQETHIWYALTNMHIFNPVVHGSMMQFFFAMGKVFATSVDNHVLTIPAGGTGCHATSRG